jgi:polyribonucleotide nucleotidyltransferase
VGETSNRLSTGNREIGHGNLAQRGIEPVLPSAETFPYTIRVVTEILESNGSSSMAATCGSTLALMAAGVPISAPGSGIALGLVSDENAGKYHILSDLQDEEDFGGDMDFKMTGTEKGVTAIQMDIKIKGLPDTVFKEALERARSGRLAILKTMLASIAEPRKELSPFAPRIETMQIDKAKIRDIIGTGGKVIREIVATTGAKVDIDDEGLIKISSSDPAQIEAARKWIAGIVEEAEVGKIYDGKVVNLVDFGAFVDIGLKDSGLVHISQLADYRVPRVEDVVSIGDELMVVVTEIDRMGRVNLSRRAAMERHMAKAGTSS